MGKPVKILIIEDSQDDAELAIQALRRSGFDPTYRLVRQPGELEGALRSERWDAVISGFMMPGFKGIDVLGVFRSRDAETPFILVSGSIGEHAAVDAIKAGASDWVMKDRLARLVPALEREMRATALRAAQRQSEHDLVESEKRFRELFDGIPLPVWVFDIETLRFLGVNAVACRTYGYTREEFLALTLRDVRPPEDIAAMELQVRRTTGALNAGIWRHRKKDGTIFFAEIISHNATFQGREARYACVIDVTQRLQAEEGIRKLSQAVEQSPAATVVTDTEGRIEYVNPKFTEVSGYAAEEVIGKTPAVINSGLTPPGVYQDLWKTIKSGASWRGTLRNRRKNGELYWEDEFISPLKNERGEIVNFIAVKEDITARLSADERTRESEMRFRQLAESIREVFWLLDPVENRLLYISPGYEQIWGRSCESLHASPRDWIESIHAEDRERVLKALQDQASGTYVEEYRIVRPDGAIRWIRDRAFPVLRGESEVYRIAGIAEDITESKHVEQRLRESERRYGDMLNNVNLIAMMIDRDATITFCNDYLLHLTGWSREEVFGRSWHEIFVPAELAGVRAAMLSDMLKEELSLLHHESEILTRSGGRRLIRWNTTALHSIAGDVAGIASLGEDITDRRKAEDEVRRLSADLERRVEERTAELEAANSELRAFAHSVSHDLRAPVNRIRGFSAMLLEEEATKLDERGADLLRRIGRAGHEMEQLIGDLLELSTVTAGELHRGDVDLSALASALFSKLQKAEPDRKAEIIVEPGLTARADPGFVRIVLDNLIGNAWKFTGKREGARIEIGCKKSGKQHAFFVRDNGAGFDPANTSKLFTPFQRLHTKSEFEGTGIGLATVQRIVRRHGGRVWAEGAVDQGATFHFTLAP